MSEPLSPPTLDQVLDSASGSAKKLLADATKRHEMIMPTIILHRGTEQIAVIAMEHGNRDHLLMVAETASYVFEPDQLTIVHDSWYALVHPNPVTGLPWQNDLGDVATEHRGRENGWVADALMVIACNRAGDLVQQTMPYRVRGRKVTWLEEHFHHYGTQHSDDEHLEGIVPNALRKMMVARTMSQDMTTDAGFVTDMMKSELGYERARAHQDCAGVKVLMRPPPHWVGFPRDLNVALSADPGSVRQQVIIESFGGKHWSDS